MKHLGKQAYASLLMGSRQKFYKIAYSYVKNEEEALDIVSEAAYRGLVHIKDLREPQYFQTWMTRIVINCALEFLRKSPGTQDCGELPEEADGECFAPQEIHLDLYAALDSLAPEDKAFIILKYFEEYSFKDMAAVLDMPESTVKSRVYRCLKIMRKKMEGGEAPL
jgi:RNA polymerase sigma-70 factor (ECF subfamily)